MTDTTEKSGPVDDDRSGDEIDFNEILERLTKAYIQRRFSEEADDNDGHETIELNYTKIKSRAVRELKKNATNHLMQVLLDQDVLTQRFFVKYDDEDELPFSIFVLQFIDKSLVAGDRVTVTMTMRDSKVQLKIESFSGVALQILAEDLEDDGFKEINPNN